MEAAGVVGILLAAGRGRRFDPEGRRNKLLQRLPGSGELVVAASARTLLAALPRVIAVVPPDDGGVVSVLAGLGCEVTVCPDADSGMAASLKHALRHSLVEPRPAPFAWLVALGDMPFVDISTLQALVDALARGAPIVMPVLQGVPGEGHRGNPVGFGRVHQAALLDLQGDQGARGLLQTSPVTAVPVRDPGILRDIDTPDALSGAC
jgi:molybdenum cofactor cytidylyltransferase